MNTVSGLVLPSVFNPNAPVMEFEPDNITVVESVPFAPIFATSELILKGPAKLNTPLNVAVPPVLRLPLVTVLIVTPPNPPMLPSRWDC